MHEYTPTKRVKWTCFECKHVNDSATDQECRKCGHQPSLGQRVSFSKDHCPLCNKIWKPGHTCE